jgi:hypothetical protein
LPVTVRSSAGAGGEPPPGPPPVSSPVAVQSYLTVTARALVGVVSGGRAEGGAPPSGRDTVKRYLRASPAAQVPRSRGVIAASLPEYTVAGAPMLVTSWMSTSSALDSAPPAGPGASAGSDCDSE